jgi:hypothetical protein
MAAAVALCNAVTAFFAKICRSGDEAFLSPRPPSRVDWARVCEMVTEPSLSTPLECQRLWKFLGERRFAVLSCPLLCSPVLSCALLCSPVLSCIVLCCLLAVRAVL